MYFIIGERARLFRCTECKIVIYTVYIYGDTYVATFCSAGTPYVSGAELCHCLLFRSAAWA